MLNLGFIRGETTISIKVIIVEANPKDFFF